MQGVCAKTLMKKIDVNFMSQKSFVQILLSKIKMDK